MLDDPETRPDGVSHPGGDRVVRAGLVLVGMLLLAANLRAGITAVGPVLGEIRGSLAISGPTASLLISLPLLGFAAVSPLAPFLARRLGLDRTLGGSLLLLAVAIIIRSVPVTGAIWVGTILLGAAVAVLNVLLPAFVKREYPERIGQVTGIYSAVQGAVAALAAGFAVPIAGMTAAGWRLSLGVWAALALIGFAVFLPRMRGRSGIAGERPESEDLPRETGTAADVYPLEPPTGGGGIGLWSSAVAWQVTLFLGLQSTVYYTVITWWPTIEQDHGISAAAAGWHQFLFQVVGITGSLAAAALIHRWRSQSVLAAGLSALVPFAVVGQLLAPQIAAVWIVMLGFSGGGTFALALSLLGLRTRDHHRAASLSGMAQTVGYLLAALGPILIGLLHQSSGSWTLPLLALAAVGTVEVTFALLAGRDRPV